MKTLNLKTTAAILFVLFSSVMARADIGANQQVQLEAQLESRVKSIIEKVDAQAIVQIRVEIKKVSSSLPGVWAQDTQTTPVATDGSLSTDGIERVQVRIITQIAEVPAWIKDEVKKALTFNNVKVETKFEKAKGTVDVKTDNSVSDSIRTYGKELASGIIEGGKAGRAITFALWSIMGALVVGLLFVATVVFLLGRKIESAVFRVVDEKLAPLMQTMGGGGGSRRSEAREVSSGGAGATANAGGFAPRVSGGGSDGGEFSQMSNDSIYALVNDCYWTNTDGYAHYIWAELNMKQREFLLSHAEFGKELFRYFTYVRQFPAESLDYHRDVRYVEAVSPFTKVNQKDLATYIQAHPAHASLVTPLRWDLLPLSLSERLKMTNSMNSAVEAKPTAAAALKASTLRELPRKLEVKTLTPDDEKFLWENPSMVPANLRSGLKTLVWLAMSPLEFRESTLREIDARDLAEAWTGPEKVLEKLKEAVAPKKFEMVQFFMKEAKPDRDGVIFAHLVSMGAQGMQETAVKAVDKQAEPTKKAVA